jgi:hypothetical protein
LSFTNNFKISFCFLTYNFYGLLYEAFDGVVNGFTTATIHKGQMANPECCSFQKATHRNNEQVSRFIDKIKKVSFYVALTQFVNKRVTNMSFLQK